MTTKPFSYDDCHPHRDGKRRAVDREGRVYVLLSDKGSGSRSLICEDEFGNIIRCYPDGRLIKNETTNNDLVGPAPEQPRISDSVINDAIDAGLKAIDILTIAKEDILHRKQLRVWLRAALECVVRS